ncbi:hypothetical protein SH661x_002485 [Planctomicrobium sp. SH661]|uniref:hypothetical protein n=1 Tax=Planctomicrobium sp. SH661 TaxID=3448124 RepID=UPI003F5C71C8
MAERSRPLGNEFLFQEPGRNLILILDLAPEKILELIAQLTRRCAELDEQLIAVVEVCGLNDWLIRMLRDCRCHRVILIQPEERKRCKTDRPARADLVTTVLRFRPLPASLL